MRALATLSFLLAAVLAGCAGSVESEPPEETETLLDLPPLDDRVRRAMLDDHETLFFNGSTSPRIGVSLGRHDVFVAEFERMPNATWIEIQVHDPVLVHYGYAIYAQDSDEPVWQTRVTDRPYVSVLVFEHGPPWTVRVWPGSTEPGFRWSSAVTQFYEEYAGKSFRALPGPEAAEHAVAP